MKKLSPKKKTKRTKIKLVDNSIDLDDKFKNVWNKHDLHELMELLKQIMFKKTKEYGFSYCQAGLASIIENLRRKYQRFMTQSHGVPVDCSKVSDQTIIDLLESLGDLGNYCTLSMMFIKKQRGVPFDLYRHSNAKYVSPIVKELGFYLPTEAEKRGFCGTNRKDKSK